MVTLILLAKYIGELALSILHFVALVDHNILPIILVELEPVLQDEVVGGDTHIPFGCLHYPLCLGSGIWVPLVDDLAD